eukprot:12590_1
MTASTTDYNAHAHMVIPYIHQVMGPIQSHPIFGKNYNFSGSKFVEAKDRAKTDKPPFKHFISSPMEEIYWHRTVTDPKHMIRDIWKVFNNPFIAIKSKPTDPPLDKFVFLSLAKEELDKANKK